MEYLTIKQAAEKWDLTTRWVQVLCATGKIEGVVKFGRAWAMRFNASVMPTLLEIRLYKRFFREKSFTIVKRPW